MPLDCTDGSLVDIVAPPTPDTDCGCDGNDITYAGQAYECTGVVPNERLNSVLSKILSKLCGIDTEVDVSGLSFDCFAVAPTGLADVADMLQYVFDNAIFKSGATCDCPVTGDINMESGVALAGCDGGSLIFTDDYATVDADSQVRVTADLKATGGFGAGYQGLTGSLDLSATATSQLNYTYGIDVNGGNRTITLPAIADASLDHKTRRLTITRLDCDSAYTVTIAADTGETVDGSASISLPIGHSYILQADDVTNDWVIVAEYYGCALQTANDGDINVVYNLGVGDSSPDAKLDVSQSDTAQIVAIFENQGAASADLVRVVRNGTTVAVFDEAGRLGVGDSNPAAMIHAKGEGSTSATYALLAENSSASDLLWVRNDGQTVVRTGVNQRFQFANGALSLLDDSDVIRDGTLTGALLTLNYIRFATSNTNLSPQSAAGARFFYISVTATDNTGTNDTVIFEVKPTYNLTGTATGNTYGFRYDPTFTSTGGTNYGVVVDDNTIKNGFGTLTPVSTLETGGSFGAKIRTVVGSASVAATDHTVLVDSSGGATAITLPNVATCAGRMYVIKKISNDANTITISGDGNIDGSASATLTNQYKAYTIQSDGAAWWIINEVD